jgi:hypothetical protein
MTKRTRAPLRPDPSELIWEDRGDGSHFAPFVAGTIDIQPSSTTGLYYASVRQVIGAAGNIGRLKELCQGWADENEPLVSSLPLMFRRRKT